MRKTTVVNIRNRPLACDVYVGRLARGMHYGNPFGYIHEDGAQTVSHAIRLKILPAGSTREDTIKAYEAWLRGTEHQEWEPERRAWILRALASGALKGKKLGCFCKPRTCHGDVLAKLAEEQASDPVR